MRTDWWRLPNRSSFARRLRTAATLSRAELLLTVRAMLWLLVVRALLPTVGFARVQRLLGRARSRPAPDGVHAGMVRRAVERAARSVRGSTCLPQALVAARLLRTAGLPAAVTIGVASPARVPGPASRGGEPHARARRAGPHTAGIHVAGGFAGGTRVPLDAHAWAKSGGLVVAGDTDLERFTELATFVVAP